MPSTFSSRVRTRSNDSPQPVSFAPGEPGREWEIGWGAGRANVVDNSAAAKVEASGVVHEREEEARR